MRRPLSRGGARPPVFPSTATDRSGMTWGLRIHTWLKGELVGEDADGNRYYRSRHSPIGHAEKRWVIFNGTNEASRVPPEWHAWLHHTTDDPIKTPPRPWMKPHVPNPTGGPGAYLPQGHDARGGRRARATGDYEAWKPE
ncbi:NADH:ubiquinone oxidoreductase subunit NDUFA12 [Roseospirillum parvum]